ncbi:MAG TPA: hypothetical protein DIU09_03805 [Hyphomonadaceae bacterium]|nr:hypothetical protein AEM38_09885 [Hyphomonadaceae bacterium UKL13-1]HCP63697.1 hypothetical protein [Hyphomonadaceae bacterium]
MDWTLTEKNLKRYLHFDSDISAVDAELLVKDPTLVSKHAFYPFILFNQHWNKWAEKGEKGEPKNRPIRYAARRDAYIFSYYRSLLASKYEERLISANLSENVLAYRKIIGPDGRGQCNIDFAKKAFDQIKNLSDCVAVTLDITRFFETLQHDKIKSDWCDLLGQPILPKDHYKVFNAITKYSYIERDVLFKELGFLGQKINPKNGAVSTGYLVSYDQMPKRQICKPSTLRSILKAKPEILTTNNVSTGIPQGAPISDLLANLYMLNFDQVMNEYALENGGIYLRYSDDIMIILPGDALIGYAARDKAFDLLAATAPNLAFKLEKTYIYTFQSKADGSLNINRDLGPANHGANGLEYLGFRFDGRSIFIRDSTLSNLWRKVARSANRHAVAVIKRYRDKSLAELYTELDVDNFAKKFGRVEEFAKHQDDVGSWTFWTYVKRCVKVFGGDVNGIASQVKAHKRVTKEKLHEALAYYYGRV